MRLGKDSGLAIEVEVVCVCVAMHGFVQHMLLMHPEPAVDRGRI